MKQMLKYILNSIIQQQQYAEQKHGFVLAINSGIIVLTVSFFSNSGPIILFLNFCVLVMCGTSLCLNLLALYSRVITIKNNKVNSLIKCNMLYFGNIAYFSEEEFLIRIKSQYNFPENYIFDNFDKDLARQIVVNSRVVAIKHRLFNKSLLFLIFGLISAVFMFATISLGGI